MVAQPLGTHHDFQKLVDSLSDVAVWVVNESSEYEYISAGFEDIWGFPPEKIREDISYLIESIHPDDREMILSEIQNSGADSSETSYVARVMQPDGSVRWVQTRQVPIHDEDGELVQVIGLSTDVTDQKRREQELEVLNRVVRHDIRNDMTIVLGWANMLEDHLDEEGKRRLERILRTGEHVVELTETARDYVDTVTGDGELESMSLRPVLRHEIELRRETYPDATFEVAEELPDVEVMANEMLSSVFRNILNNAIQHNDTDEPRVSISCREENGSPSSTSPTTAPESATGRRNRSSGKGRAASIAPGAGSASISSGC